MKQILSNSLLLLIFIICKSDLTIPGEVDKEFKIINISDFKDFKFTFCIQHYKYEQGYKPTNIETKEIIQNEVYSCSNHGDHSKIFATDSLGNVFESYTLVGGKQNFADNVQGFVEVYKIISVENKIVELKLVETITRVKRFGQTKEVVKKVGKLGFNNLVTIGLVLSSIFSVIGLVMLYKSTEKKMN
jgi:hypothetical protein